VFPGPLPYDHMRQATSVCIPCIICTDSRIWIWISIPKNLIKNLMGQRFFSYSAARKLYSTSASGMDSIVPVIRRMFTRTLTPVLPTPCDEVMPPRDRWITQMNIWWKLFDLLPAMTLPGITILEYGIIPSILCWLIYPWEGRYGEILRSIPATNLGAYRYRRAQIPEI